MADWTRMSNKELRESGLLWHVNRAALWPLGLALAVVKEDGEYTDEMFVQKVEPFEPIIDGATDEERGKQADDFAAWLKARLGG